MCVVNCVCGNFAQKGAADPLPFKEPRIRLFLKTQRAEERTGMGGGGGSHCTYDIATICLYPFLLLAPEAASRVVNFEMERKDYEIEEEEKDSKSEDEDEDADKVDLPTTRLNLFSVGSEIGELKKQKLYVCKPLASQIPGVLFTTTTKNIIVIGPCGAKEIGIWESSRQNPPTLQSKKFSVS